MKSILLIGLGRFGRHMAMKLQQLHHEVLAIDRREQRVNDALSFVTNAQIGDSTNESFIASLGVRNFDLCVVAIGDDFQSSLETTALLKEHGAPFVLSRATRKSMPNFCCAMEPTTSSIRKSKWQSGPPSDTAATIFSIIFA